MENSLCPTRVSYQHANQAGSLTHIHIVAGQQGELAGCSVCKHVADIVAYPAASESGYCTQTYTLGRSNKFMHVFACTPACVCTYMCLFHNHCHIISFHAVDRLLRTHTHIAGRRLLFSSLCTSLNGISLSMQIYHSYALLGGCISKQIHTA